MSASMGTLVRIYRMADKQGQMLVAGLLNGISGLTARHGDRKGITCLVVTCASIDHANAGDETAHGTGANAHAMQLTGLAELLAKRISESRCLKSDLFGWSARWC
jgi:hypothetical protein